MTHLLSEYADWILIVLIADTLIILIESMVIFRIYKKQRSQRQSQTVPLYEEEKLINPNGCVTETNVPDVREEVRPIEYETLVDKQDIAATIASEVEDIDIIEEEDRIRKTSVLLIEDDLAMQHSYLKALENDYTVICQTAPNIAYAPGSEKFDIAIISEPLFPYTIKYKEILKRIKALDKSDARKIVVLADNVTDTQLSNGYKEGIDLFLKKPITPEELQYNLKSLYADISIASLPPYRHLSGKPLSNEDHRFIRSLT